MDITVYVCQLLLCRTRNLLHHYIESLTSFFVGGAGKRVLYPEDNIRFVSITTIAPDRLVFTLPQSFSQDSIAY
jgi:hypothetical protein